MPETGCDTTVSVRLNLDAIEQSLRCVQRDFALINQGIRAERQPMTDEVLHNVLTGYRHVDRALAQNIDLLEPGSLVELLELNALILCGPERRKRREFARHLKSTEQHFYHNGQGNIRDLVEWHQDHVGDSIWRQAAGVYIHVLSRPQLFLEGNHRTGSLLMSFLLARAGRPPFVLTVDNAQAYFEPSSLIRNTKRHGVLTSLGLPKLRRRFARMLRETSDTRHLRRCKAADDICSDPTG